LKTIIFKTMWDIMTYQRELRRLAELHIKHNSEGLGVGEFDEYAELVEALEHLLPVVNNT